MKRNALGFIHSFFFLDWKDKITKFSVKEN